MEICKELLDPIECIFQHAETGELFFSNVELRCIQHGRRDLSNQAF